MDQVQEIDVEQIMRRIREKVRRRRDAEGHPMSERRAFSFDDGQTAADLASLNSGYDIQQVSFASHRRILGPLVVAVKKALGKLLTPILERQIAYNAASVRVVNHVRDSIETLNRRQAQINDQIEAFERRQADAEFKLREEILADKSQALHEMHYAGFEERFRGSEEDIKERQRIYVQYFAGRENVIDIGCGRGGFLELLRESGITARGVDLGLDMVRLCREKGLDVTMDDAFAYLEALADDSVGGIFAAQVIEHLLPRRVIELVKLCYRKLAPGGHLILETPNPRCLMVFADSFYKDPSHVQPAHPDTMQFLFESVGLHEVELGFSAPVDPSMRIPSLEAPGADLEPFNRGIERLNSLLFGFQDYAVIGRKVLAKARQDLIAPGPAS